MKRKRRNSIIIIFITILFIAAYLLSSSLFFFIYEEREINEYQSYVEMELNERNRGYYDWFTPDTLMADYSSVFNDFGYTPYPSLAAVFDENGEMVSQMGTYISCPESMDANDPDPRYTNKIFLEEYFTPEIKAQIFEFCDYLEHVEHIRVSEINYIIRDQKIIPISFMLFNTLDNMDEHFEVVLSDEEYSDVKTLKYPEDEYPYGLYLQLFDINDNSNDHETYEYLREILSNQKDLAIKTYEDDFWYKNTEKDNSLFLNRITLEDGDYVLVTASVFDPVFTVLHTVDFINVMTYQTVLFAVFYVASIILLLIHFKRSKKLEESKIAFTSAAAHELKTPLAVIENQCECIMENIAPEKNEEYVKSIYSESLRMNKLVATLLQYNRLASAESIKKEKCDLAEIVKAEIEKYRPLIESKNILLETNVMNSIEVNCNKELIALVVDNYLSNAVKHTDKRISITLNGNTFAVFNEGKNIDPKLKKNLWDIFYRDDEARNSEDHSTGMGLAICKQILEHHRYAYGFVNKSDGVEFYFKTN